MPRPPELQNLILSLHKIGATPLIVGGAVRDWVLGLEPKDFDVEVFSIDQEKLEQTLASHGKIDLVGKSFGVYKLAIGKLVYDISLPRKDSKVVESQGHKSIRAESNPHLTPLEASLRRDFTINSLFYDPIKESLMDPHGGIEDIKRRLLRHTSQAFSEDPLRSLRAVQFSARFGFSIDPSTARLCQELHEKGELNSLSQERIREELNKFLIKGKHHIQAIEVLRQTRWLEQFPELEKLDSVDQDPQWHPEGNVLKHTFHALEALQNIDKYKALDDNEKLIYCLGVLCHDLGKPSTTYKEYREELGREVITSPNHPRKGLKPTEQLLQRFGYGNAIIRRAKLLTLYHMDHLWVNDAKAVKLLAAKLSPFNPHSESPKIEETIAGLSIVIEADHGGRPPLEKGLPQKMVKILEIARKEGCLTQPVKTHLRGQDLIKLGLPESKILGSILKTTYKKQISGENLDKETLIKWVSKNFRRLVIDSGGPKPLITGDDLKTANLKPNKEFTEILNSAYKKQIQGGLKDKTQAENWLKSYVTKLEKANNNLAI